MARLHPRLEPALEQLPRQTPVHLLTRHSVREEADGGFADYRLQLTEEGVRLAEDWGARLGRPISRLTSSPVPRCVDTARALHRGGLRQGLARDEPEVEEASVLVEPGSYVQDVRAASTFFELGAVGFINRHLGEGIRGVLTPAEGRTRLVRYLLEREPEPGALAVHVTHDTILAAFVAGLHGHARIEADDWPWMMEGLWLWFADEQLHWIWRGESARRSLSDILEPAGC